MITIKTYFTVEDANLDRSRLASEGIDAFVSDENTASVAPFFVTSTGGVRLMVEDEAAEEAASIVGADPKQFSVEVATAADRRQLFRRRTGTLLFLSFLIVALVTFSILLYQALTGESAN